MNNYEGEVVFTPVWPAGGVNVLLRQEWNADGWSCSSYVVLI